MYESKNLPLRVLPISNHLMLLHLLIQLTLQRAHPNLDHLLHLIRQLALHVLLQPSQQERPQHLMQAPDNKQGLFFVQLDLVARAGVGEGRVEPLVEGLDGVEDLGEDEVEQGPELGEVVLQGGSGEEEAVAGVVRTTLRRVALVRDDPDARSPLGELARPVGHGGEGHDDEVGPALALGLDEEDTVEPVVVQADHPLETLELILFQPATDKNARLLSDLLRYPVSHGIVINLPVLLHIIWIDLSTEGCLIRRSLFLIKPVLGGTVDGDDLLAVGADDAELLDVLVLGPPFSLEALSALELLDGAGVPDGGLAGLAELEAVEGEHGAVDEALGDLSSHGALLVEHAEGLELDEGSGAGVDEGAVGLEGLEGRGDGAVVLLVGFGLVVLHHVDVGLEGAVAHGGGHGLELADALLDTGLDEPLALVNDLVGVEPSWHDGGDDEALQPGGEEGWVELGGSLEVREGVPVGVVGVDATVDIVFQERSLGVLCRVDGGSIDVLCLDRVLSFRSGGCNGRRRGLPLGCLHCCVDDARRDIWAVQRFFEILNGIIGDADGLLEVLGDGGTAGDELEGLYLCTEGVDLVGGEGDGCLGCRGELRGHGSGGDGRRGCGAIDMAVGHGLGIVLEGHAASWWWSAGDTRKREMAANFHA
ncbi:hypothetical protein CVT26_009767 [Gymnopilus dilepis]|uniref:Uncharacterized protein n=1 Tax=Gymnopilus dilepis TaxID=231916 RepID=A0A409VKI2_9AGAR|nr:hypothetical protein CVT26_009767 [Gymnopilus dilepis]